MKKELAFTIVQSRWGENFKFDMEDSHAMYFKSSTEEMKVRGCDEGTHIILESRDIGKEDWECIDYLSEEDVKEIVKSREVRNKQNEYER
ncbi:hypothetical protein MKZ02_22540 [Pseudobacillus sp. FSL P4-0506]|uniref:hypothetical protein n=1 Tax=unclassified Pseudobacillus TaxID=2619284 RepID=UPI0030FB5520